MSEFESKRWRDLCNAAAEEEDPHKLSSLVQELNLIMDEEERSRAEPRQKREQVGRRSQC